MADMKIVLIKTIRWIGIFGTFFCCVPLYGLRGEIGEAFWMVLGALLIFAAMWRVAGQKLK
jgi:hypothetical protein